MLARVHALTILLGAFLLFQVQPLLGKWILPWFGGGTAVWTTCLLFFQAALFAGYAYAYASERLLPPRWQLAVHFGLILTAVLLLPIGPSDAWKPAGTEDPAWAILLLLGATIGAPYVLLASTGPLVQAWFSRAYPGRSPYRLYALSNAGSLAALLSYPILIEPMWGLRTQSLLWMGLFLVVAGLHVAGSLTARRVPATAIAAAPTVRHWVRWITLPAFASFMLVATTNQLGQDVGVMPLLWVLPLAAYLLSFIAAFDHPRWYSPRLFALATLALVVVAAYTQRLYSREPMGILLAILTMVSPLYCICMLCHGELARLQPAPRFLTGYYLAISAGGALGSMLVSLVAPQVFSTLLEWKLGLIVAYCAAGSMLVWRLRHRPGRAVLLGVVAIELLAACLFWFRSANPELESARNFYGVVTVKEFKGKKGPKWDWRVLVNGTILHGQQYLDVTRREEPTTYYVEASGVGRALEFFWGREDMRVGAVGLGVGTLAVYGALPSQSFRFYEINPEVVRLAEEYFSYLADCRGKATVTVGDARLSLEREPPQRFHVLALDAFSGDSIPTHLLTVEAMKLYLGHLAPDGVIAIHTSSRFLDLAPVVRGVAHDVGLTIIEVDLKRSRENSRASNWILCTRNQALVLELSQYATQAAGSPETVWTDDRSDLFSIIRWR